MKQMQTDSSVRVSRPTYREALLLVLHDLIH